MVNGGGGLSQRRQQWQGQTQLVLGCKDVLWVRVCVSRGASLDVRWSPPVFRKRHFHSHLDFPQELRSTASSITLLPACVWDLWGRRIYTNIAMFRRTADTYDDACCHVGILSCWCIVVLVNCRVGVLLCWCIFMLVYCHVGVLSCWCIVVLVYWRVDVLLCWCIVVLVYCRVGVLSCWCIVMLVYCCIDVLSCCCIVVLVYCCVGVLMCWCIVVLVYCCVGVLSCWCIVVLSCCCVVVLWCAFIIFATAESLNQILLFAVKVQPHSSSYPWGLII